MPNFPHEMLREIYEQPEALTRTLDLYLAGRSLEARSCRKARRTGLTRTAKF